MDYSKLFSPEISGEAVKAWRAQGKKAMGVLCCHLPEEVFYAADVLPVRLRATGCVDSSDAEAWMSSFSCSFARSILQYWLDGKYELDGFVASDGCMQASRVFDNAKHINAKDNMGQAIIQIAAPRKHGERNVLFYRDELGDLIAELEKLSGVKVTDEALAAAVDKYNEARRLVKQVYELRKEKAPVISGEDALKITLASCDIPIDEYIELLKAFLADAANRKPVEGVRARIMLIGSALDDPGYIKIIEEKGGLVVCDALCFGSRGFNDEMEYTKGDVLTSIARYYLNRKVCPRMIDNRPELHDYIIKTAKEFGVDGIIYEKMQNCECWGGENILLNDELKEAGIPLLTVEREEQLANAGQLAIRAEAFIEMIEKEG